MEKKKAKTFKDYLRNADLSGAQLGRRLGVTREQVSHWATGKARPRPNNVKKMAVILNVDYLELLQVFYNE